MSDARIMIQLTVYTRSPDADGQCEIVLYRPEVSDDGTFVGEVQLSGSIEFVSPAIGNDPIQTTIAMIGLVSLQLEIFEHNGGHTYLDAARGAGSIGSTYAIWNQSAQELCRSILSKEDAKRAKE